MAIDLSAPLLSGWSMPVAASCRDQPGARIEDHSVFGPVVRGEHFSEALNGTVGLVAAEDGKGLAN
jgi:hypothetical protein